MCHLCKRRDLILNPSLKTTWTIGHQIILNWYVPYHLMLIQE